MENRDLYKAIEVLTLEKKKKNNILKKVKQINIKKIQKFIMTIRLNRLPVSYNNKGTIFGPEKSGKIAVYTCITGGYDDFVEHLVYEDGIDYFVFTDNNDLRVPKQVKKIMITGSLLSKGNIYANRYIKLNPHSFFSEYDFSIYIDGNIRVNSNISEYINVKSKLGVIMHRHPLRVCVFEEAKACEILKKGNKFKIKEYLSFLVNEKFPKKFGLCEANLIITDIQHELSKKVLNQWWDDFLLFQTNRDQLILPYTIWKMGYCIEDLGLIESSVLEGSKMELYGHN